ncbi:MAG: hypothetical protein H8E21_05485 [Gammaproteobacteria bacterium]|nr:hypothetical protein [Gammaproteobacteria bacterium]
MIFDISTALTWILFLALFPMSFIWLRRAWRILAKRDYSEVALRHGESPPNPERYAMKAFTINLLGGLLATMTIIGVVTAYFDFKTWNMIAGMTIWCKIFADFAVSRHAHWGLGRGGKAS